MVKGAHQISHFSVAPKTLLTLLGITIAEYPEKINVLLNKYGIKSSDDLNDKELADKIITALSRQNRKFNEDLSSLVLKELDLLENYDAFAKGLFKKGNNPVSAIANGLGAIFGKIGTRKERKAQAQNARAQTFTSIMAYKSEKGKSKGRKTKVIIGVVIGILLLAGITMYALTRKQTILSNAE